MANDQIITPPSASSTNGLINNFNPKSTDPVYSTTTTTPFNPKSTDPVYSTTTTTPFNPKSTDPVYSTTGAPAAGVPPAPSAPQPTLPPLQPVGAVQGYTPATGEAAPATATGYDATQSTVPDKGLVQNQVLDIVGNDSPLMQQARARAMDVMNQRGLSNSSLAATAGQSAVLDAALPIASADAASNKEAAFRTADAQNQAAQFNTGATNTANLANSQLISSMNQFNANAINGQLAQTSQAENTRNLSLIDVNNRQALAVLDAQNRQLLQTNANSANMFQEVVKNIAAISADPTMSRTAKDAAIATQMNMLSEGLKTTGDIAGQLPAEVDNLNLGQYFQPIAPNAFSPAQKQAAITRINQQISDLQRQRDATAREPDRWRETLALDNQMAGLRQQLKNQYGTTVPAPPPAPTAPAGSPFANVPGIINEIT